MPPLGWVDITMLGLLGMSMIVGLWRGLTFEVLSLLGWVAAYVAAQAFSPALAAQLPISTPESPVRHAAAFAGVFIAALLVWSVLARLVRLAVHATPLTVLDRLLGAIFGLLRGVIVLLAVATLVAFTPVVRSPAWTSSQGASWLGQLLQALKPMLPDDLARRLPA